MQRKSNFTVTNCNIKMPDCLPDMEPGNCDDENEHHHRRQQLINFGHAQWGYENWNWSVTKQELDFVDFANGKYCAGVVAFVSVTVKTLDLHRDNIGYATSIANNKGMAIYKSRKCAVTNALRETLLSFGGTLASKLTEMNVETARTEINNPVTLAPESPTSETVTSVTRPIDTSKDKNPPLPVTRKELNGVGSRAGAPPPVARAHPMPVNLPRVTCPPPARGPVPGPRNQNDAVDVGLESMTEEEARAERKRRQRLAQEEFKQKQLLKRNLGLG